MNTAFSSNVGWASLTAAAIIGGYIGYKQNEAAQLQRIKGIVKNPNRQLQLCHYLLLSSSHHHHNIHASHHHHNEKSSLLLSQLPSSSFLLSQLPS